jgi:Amt family ammonium transporter
MGDARKPSVLGMISGAVAGLGTITPASGFVLPWHGIVIGMIAGLLCFWACTKLKHRSATTTRSTCSACTASAA